MGTGSHIYNVCRETRMLLLGYQEVINGLKSYICPVPFFSS